MCIYVPRTKKQQQLFDSNTIFNRLSQNTPNREYALYMYLNKLPELPAW